MAIPEFRTKRLKLRGYTDKDLDDLFQIVSDTDVIKYMPRTDPWPRGVVDRMSGLQRDHWIKIGYGWWAVEEQSSQEFIGWCGLCFLEETLETEVKYLFKKSHWGRGLASEGAKFAVDYGLQVLNLNKIIGLVHPQNIASQRVLEKCGLNYKMLAEYFGMTLKKYEIKNAG